MNTTALKPFAQAARRDLLDAVGRKLDIMLAANEPDYRTTYAPQVAALRELAAADRAGLVERVAYTWFNRLAALRYLDARGWHPFRARVLTAADASETQPELLKLMRTGALPGELERWANPERLGDLLDGRLPSADPQGEVYRALVLAACRFYHALLPDLFERLDDATELLLPDDLLTERSVARRFRAELSDADCAEVEVLGWLYQFYISEKKDAVMARKAAVPAADIPAVTQLFTPHWIVRYLVENSLGRLWLLNRPGSRLRERMPYYVEGEAEAEFLRVAGPEEIRLLDPAVGSGHMLTYAFDLLYAIYEEEGYAPSEIAGLILTHNLYGVDIDPRAAQLAQLALVLKARERSRGFFRPGGFVAPRVIALVDVRFDAGELREYVRALELGALFDERVMRLLAQFEEATTFGSLIRPVLGAGEIEELRRVIAARDVGGQLLLSATHEKVMRVLDQAEHLTARHHVVIANPPYMGSNKFGAALKEFTAREFPDGKADLYSCFLLRNLDLLAKGGLCAMITLPNWMFLGSFADLRHRLLNQHYFPSLLHNGRGLWGGDFGSCAFVVEGAPNPDGLGHFKRLFDKQGEINPGEVLEKRFFDNAAYPPHRTSARRMLKLPEQPIAYWVTDTVAELFASAPPLSAVGAPRQGLATGDNDQFLRYWWEPASARVNLGAVSVQDAVQSRARWFPYHKGGAFQKWYGNLDYVIDWEQDGKRIRNFVDDDGNLRSRPQNLGYSFRECMTWSTVTISRLSMRYSPSGFICGAKGSGCFFDRRADLEYGLALMNTVVVDRLLLALAPTADYSQGPIGRIPYVVANAAQVRAITHTCVELARADWDASETSWSYAGSPLVRRTTEPKSLSSGWRTWEDDCNRAISQMQCYETENNQLFINAYGLDGELSPEVGAEDVTLSRAEARTDAAAFLSYAVGCMM